MTDAGMSWAGMEHPCELVLSSGLSLIHDPCRGEGKTRGMAKGLFISFRGRICSGESAGLGLPVLKMKGQTYFPTLFRVRAAGSRAIEKRFLMDRVLVWHVGGRKAPAGIGLLMESIAGAYMKSPALQSRLLRFRDMLFALLRVRSAMVPAVAKGEYRVLYEAIPQGVQVHVEGEPATCDGKLIVLNEADGRSFNTLTIGRTLFRENEIPAWVPSTFDAVFTSPSEGLSFSLAPEEGRSGQDYTLFCGREVGALLDWAGISITNGSSLLTYRVFFRPL